MRHLTQHFEPHLGSAESLCEYSFKGNAQSWPREVRSRDDVVRPIGETSGFADNRTHVMFPYPESTPVVPRMWAGSHSF